MILTAARHVTLTLYNHPGALDCEFHACLEPCPSFARLAFAAVNHMIVLQRTAHSKKFVYLDG